LLEEVRKRSVAGVAVNWSEIQPFKTQVVTSIRSQLEASLKTLKINLVRGTAQFNWSSSVQVTSSSGVQTVALSYTVSRTEKNSFQISSSRSSASC
jgi:pyruvate/2-oxoglutarate dehydrogenase complex dihydrolipoamide dehydrogenase (E3) component